MKLGEKLRALLQPVGTVSAVAPVFRRVLLVVHNPREQVANGRKLHQILHWHDPDELAAQYIADLREASSGYANFEIADRLEVDAFPQKEDGFQYDIDTYLYRWRSRTGFHVPDRVDYAALLRQFKMVSRINLGQVDEVWLMGFPYAGYYESIMAGPDAFWCNAPPLEGYGRCNRRFVIMGFNYERGVGEMLESFGHRAESIMAHVYRQKRGAANLWERFTRHEKTHPGQSECGTVHFAPNSERDYDWGNRRWVRSFCANWLDFPDLNGSSQRVNCSEWGDGDIHAHHMWWLRHLPHGNGRADGIAHNWWSYIVDPNLVR
ncbi:MAG: hypothetical protein H6662_19950 [Ardenticatenaceae bacterium]|nr:hypothetical protein [Anaerolineales bacterium]MCB8923858.1 hypothetical protein [Ardenticatenaceae bacterium]MCB9003363.1 hypothetical protein [Ardenticatenaceae bacterium]